MPVPRAPLWERVSKISYCWLEFLEFLHDLLLATSISKLVRTLRPCSSRRTACTPLGDVQVRELGCEQIRVNVLPGLPAGVLDYCSVKDGSKSLRCRCCLDGNRRT